MSKHVVCWLRACIRVPGVILAVREQGFLCWVQVVRLSVSGMPLGGWGCQERFTVETLHSCSQGQPLINCDELFFISLPQFISSNIFLGSIPFFQYHHFNAITTTHLLLYSFNNLNICPLRAAWLVNVLTHGGPIFFCQVTTHITWLICHKPCLSMVY